MGPISPQAWSESERKKNNQQREGRQGDAGTKGLFQKQALQKPKTTCDKERGGVDVGGQGGTKQMGMQGELDKGKSNHSERPLKELRHWRREFGRIK